MTVVKAASPSLKSLAIVSMTAIGLLAACGEQVSSEGPMSSATESGSKANSTTQCFNAVGPKSSDDAEMFAASGVGDVRRVEQFIDTGRNVNAADSLKRTPLFAATFCNHPEMAKLLIAKGTDINARDFLGMSSLHAAAVLGWSTVAKTLIQGGANINSQDTLGHTPLHLAAATNQIAMVEFLLKQGANSQVRDRDGTIAGSLAGNNGHKSVDVMIKKWHEKQITSIEK